MATILSKKRKKQKQTTLSNLKTLGNDLLSSRSHINNLPILLSFISPTSRPDFTLESLLSLQAFFTPVLPDLPSFTSKHSSLDESQNDPEFIYRAWLRSKFDEFVTSLIEVSLSPLSDEVLKEVALNTIMEFVKLGNEGRFQSAIYHRFIFSMVHSTDPVEVLVDLLASKYLKYIDVRYFTYISLEKIARILEGKDNSDNKNPSRDSNKNHSEENTEQLISKMHCILSHVPSLEGSVGKTDYEVWAGSVQNEEPSENNKASHDQNGTEKHNFKALSAASIAKKMKLKFTKAWLSFIRLPLPLYVYKAVLVSLHQEVIPHLSNPVVLCDFLTRSYDIGGVVSVMALSSLYILMMQHGLEYLNFYEKLYALLVPSIFMAKHRAKFFELLDSCLKSPLLPAYLAAAFAKRLSRLSIAAPPSGALVIIALIHNLLRRHPSINFLVHQENTVETAEHDSEVEKKTIDVNMKLGIDCFNNEERDPKKTHAMRSSLWEIDTLRHHYCPAVSRLVLSLENDLTVRAKTTELSIKDFSSASYATIFGSEVNRRMKQVPLALHRAIPTSLFSESEFAGWTFKHDKKDRCARENGANESNSTTEIDGFNNSSLKRLRSEAE